MDQPDKVTNPACGQLNREKIFPCSRACLRIWPRETGSAVPSRVSLLISILRLNLVLTYGIPPEFLPIIAIESLRLPYVLPELNKNGEKNASPKLCIFEE